MRVIYTTSDNIGSLAIRAFEGGQASHVGIVVGSHVIDASWTHGGVRSWPAHLWQIMDGRRVVDEIEFAVPDEMAAERFVLDQVGKRYDTSFVLGFLAWRNWQRPDRWACSELAMAAALAGGRTFSERHARIGVRLSRAVFGAWAAHAL